MPIGIGLAVAAGAGLVGSAMQANAVRGAAQTQADANARAQNQLLETGQQASQNFQPYTYAGQQGLNYLGALIPAFAGAPSTYQPQANYMPMTNADLNAQLAPNYAFQLQQGQGAQNAAANVAGGMIGGNALKGLQDYTQNFAGNAYQNALNNYMAQYQLGLSSNMGQQAQAYNQQTANQTNIFNRLSGIADLGFKGATGAANTQLGVGSGISQLTQGIGQAQAAGQVGVATSLAGGLQNVGNAGMYYGLMQNNQLSPYVQAAKLNQQYGANNVYGVGGGGTVPTTFTGE